MVHARFIDNNAIKIIITCNIIKYISIKLYLNKDKLFILFLLLQCPLSIYEHCYNFTLCVSLIDNQTKNDQHMFLTIVQGCNSNIMMDYLNKNSLTSYPPQLYMYNFTRSMYTSIID